MSLRDLRIYQFVSFRAAKVGAAVSRPQLRAVPQSTGVLTLDQDTVFTMP
jgi:hypothetical protein